MSPSTPRAVFFPFPPFHVPPPPPADTTGGTLSQRTLDVLEYWGKLAGALTIVGAFIGGLVYKVIRPFLAWRRKSTALMMREILKDELGRLDAVSSREEEVFRQLGAIYARQTEVFNDVDAFLELAAINSERIDEINSLMDAVGMASDRRSPPGGGGGTTGPDPETRGRIAELFTGLNDRRKSRRRYDSTPDREERRRRFGQLHDERLAGFADRADAADEAAEQKNRRDRCDVGDDPDRHEPRYNPKGYP